MIRVSERPDIGPRSPRLPPQRPSGTGATKQEGSHWAWSSHGGLQGGPRLGLAPEGRRSVSSQEGKYRKRNMSGGPVTEDQTRQPSPASAGGGGDGAARVQGGLGTASPQRWARWSRPACSPRQPLGLCSGQAFCVQGVGGGPGSRGRWGVAPRGAQEAGAAVKPHSPGWAGEACVGFGGSGGRLSARAQ